MRTITTLEGNSQRLDGGAMFGNAPKALWSRWVDADDQNRIALSCRAMLVQEDDRNILVETGIGAFFAPNLKSRYGVVEDRHVLLDSLAEIGLTDADIDVVVLTHLHFDHSGGCTKLDRSGSAVPTFPKAEYMVQQRCWDEAMDPNERFEDSFHKDDFLPLKEKGVHKTIDGDTEVMPGVNVKVTDGPSRGHQIVLVERGSERIAFASDLIPTPYHLPLPHISATDEFPNGTLEQKKELLEMAVNGGWLMVFGHGHDYRAGYVQQKNGSAQLVPVEM